MFRPVLSGWIHKHRAAIVASLACVVFMVGLSPLPLGEAGSRTQARSATALAEPTRVISVHVQVEGDACTGADSECRKTNASAADAGTRGVPLRLARVRLLRAEAGYYVPCAETQTDDAGRARLEATPGTFWLMVEAPGRARRSEQLILDTDPRRVRLLLPSAAPLRVTVRDEAGQPVTAATVLAQDGDALPHAAATSAEGIASFADVGEPIESISVQAQGYESAVVHPTSREVALVVSSPATLSVNVLDAEGKPAAGAEVWLGGLGFWPPRQVLAGADGVAHVDGLSHGSYDLRARLGAQVSAALAGVTLKRGEQGRMTLQLVAGRLIAVRVTDGAAANATPVAGADVVLVEDGLSPFPLEGRTDSAGRVTLGPLPPRPAVINARAQGFVAQNGLPVARDASGEIQIGLLRAGRVLGEVVDAAGLPIEGARLEVLGNDLQGRPIARTLSMPSLPSSSVEQVSMPLPPIVSPLLVPMGELGVLPGPLPRPLPDMPASELVPNAGWASGLDGRYRLEDVPPGRLQLLVHHPDFVDTLSDWLTLAPGGEGHVRVVLERGAALEGRVLDQLGRPVAKARVDAVAAHGTQQRSVLSDSDGRFAFGAVSTEVDLLLARPEDRSHFVLRRALELKPGEQRELDLVLPAERAPLLVLVSAEDAQPITGAQVTLASTDPDVPLRQTSYSDASGQVLMPDAAGLRGTLRVEMAGFRAFEAQLGAVPARVEVTLARGVALIGRITHVRGRQGLAGAQVVLIQDGARQSTRSDAQGEYRFAEASPGAASVRASHPEFSSETLDVMIVATGREDRPFELEPIELTEAGLISGTVLDEAGEPVSGARVGVGFVPAFLPAGAIPSEMVLSDAAGAFELRGVKPGAVTLSAYAASAGRASVSGVEVSAGRTTTGVALQLHGGNSEAEPGALANVAITLGERSRGGQVEVVIVDVAAGSEAERAGLRADDVVQAVDGAAIDSMSDARRRLGGSNGSDVVIELDRQGEFLSLRVRRQAVRR
jgi:carboxypeptidase family protein/PDZ domain-containing protein